MDSLNCFAKEGQAAPAAAAPAAAAAADSVARGNLFVVSAPSGAGKTSITSRLRALGLVRVSVSHTTRPPRGSEKDGEAYFFVSRAAFIAMREENRFLEWAEVYGNFYGTSRDWVNNALAGGQDVLLEIDCQGAAQIRRQFPAAVLIFISPPDIGALRERLRRRRQDSDAALEKRLAAAEEEMAQKKFFDYVIINAQLEDAVREVAAVIRRFSLSSPSLSNP